MLRAVLLATAVSVLPVAHAAAPETVAGQIKALLQQPPPGDLQGSKSFSDDIESFYQRRDFAPAWMDGSEPKAHVQQLLNSLAAAGDHGLRVADYAPEEIRQKLQGLSSDAGASAEMDLRLTYTFFDFANDLSAGRINPDAVDPRWVTTVQRKDYGVRLEEALQTQDIAAALAGMAPQQPGYRRLQVALADYRQQAENGEWPAVPAGDLVEIGDASPRVAALRRRLAASKELGEAAPADSPEANTLDEKLAEALRAFQRRHGLLVDGLLGAGSVKALNVSIEQRIREIEINLERWRWLPDNLGERSIVVNVPDYSLTTFNGNTPAMRMGVIVGKQYNDRATPIFTDSLQRVVFRPYWGIPHSIASEEILPKAREDLGYLARKNYQIVNNYRADAIVHATTAANLEKVGRGELRLRETPGPENSLGLVKFLFPNQFAVYLHDTPADHLFEKDKRDFSHGCIRVERPAHLAEWVFNRQSGWDLSQVQAAMRGNQRQRVELEQPVPVYILYWTAFVERGGEVQFRPDLYGHDEMLNKALSQAGTSS